MPFSPAYLSLKEDDLVYKGFAYLLLTELRKKLARDLGVPITEIIQIGKASEQIKNECDTNSKISRQRLEDILNDLERQIREKYASENELNDFARN